MTNGDEALLLLTDMLNELKDLRGEEPRAIAVVFWAYIKELIKLNYKVKFPNGTQTRPKEMLDELKGTDFIDDDLINSVTHISKIRGIFGHELKPSKGWKKVVIKKFETEVNQITVLKPLGKKYLGSKTTEQKFWKGCHIVINRLIETYRLQLNPQFRGNTTYGSI